MVSSWDTWLNDRRIPLHHSMARGLVLCAAALARLNAMSYYTKSVNFGSIKKGDYFFSRGIRYTKTMVEDLNYQQCNARYEEWKVAYFSDSAIVDVLIKVDEAMLARNIMFGKFANSRKERWNVNHEPVKGIEMSTQKFDDLIALYSVGRKAQKALNWYEEMKKLPDATRPENPDALISLTVRTIFGTGAEGAGEILRYLNMAAGGYLGQILNDALTLAQIDVDKAKREMKS